MKKFYFTFCNDHPVYANTVCVVEAESYGAAREKFIEKFGTRFAFQYTQEQVDKWPSEPWYKYAPKQTFAEFDRLDYVDPIPTRNNIWH